MSSRDLIILLDHSRIYLLYINRGIHDAAAPCLKLIAKIQLPRQISGSPRYHAMQDKVHMDDEAHQIPMNVPHSTACFTFESYPDQSKHDEISDSKLPSSHAQA